jgi:hypothetical protein
MLVVINASKQKAIKERFGREMDSLYMEAKRATVANQASIPMWLYFVLLVLGWNEIMMVLRNPILTLLVILIVTVSYMAYYTGMSHPILQIVKATFQESWNQTKGLLKEKGFDIDALIDLESARQFFDGLYDIHTPPNEIEMEDITS